MRFASSTPFVLAFLLASASASPLAIANPALSERQIIGSGSTSLVDGRSFVTAAGRLKRNRAYWAWYPDDGVVQYGSQGTAQTLQELDAATGSPAVAVGAYANVEARTYIPEDPATHFDGADFLPFLQQAIDGQAIFVASILPVHGYGGFQPNDTRQIEATINVLRNFVNAGVEVWLRFGHEANWYTQRGSDYTDPAGGQYYAGGPADFVVAYQTIVKVVRTALPTVKHMWSPNIGGIDELLAYWPGPEFVDIVALDFYVEYQAPDWRYEYLEGLIIQTHDIFALQFGKPFWLGETGTRTSSSDLNLRFIDTITSVGTCASMPNYQGAFWFNYIKGNIDHNVAVPGGSAVTTRFVQLMSTSGTL